LFHSDVIDIHCHILPEVDDGPKSWEASETMCRIAAQDGIEHIVATPHANDCYFYDRPYFEELLRSLASRIGEKPALSLGCDFHLSEENMQNALRDPERYAIANTRYLLVEFSNTRISRSVDDWFRGMHHEGIRPIITHPERNPLLRKDPARIFAWLELGASVQLTASSLAGHWGKAAQRTSEWLLRKKAVAFLASDAHDPIRRPPILSKAKKLVAEGFGEKLARTLVDTNPRAVIRNRPLAAAGL
jgi:protein-tyrosine phosphatase